MIKKTKNSSIYSLTILLCFLLAAEALPLEFPDNPAGLRAKEIVSLLNGEFPRSAEEYIQNDYAPGFRDAFPIQGHLDAFQRIMEAYGSLELAGITSSDETDLHVVLKAKNKEAWLNLIIQIEPEKPHRIARLGFSP